MPQEKVKRSKKAESFKVPIVVEIRVSCRFIDAIKLRLAGPEFRKELIEKIRAGVETGKASNPAPKRGGPEHG